MIVPLPACPFCEVVSANDYRVKVVAFCTMTATRALLYCPRSSLPKKWEWKNKKSI